MVDRCSYQLAPSKCFSKASCQLGLNWHCHPHGSPSLPRSAMLWTQCSPLTHRSRGVSACGREMCVLYAHTHILGTERSLSVNETRRGGVKLVCLDWPYMTLMAEFQHFLVAITETESSAVHCMDVYCILLKIINYSFFLLYCRQIELFDVIWTLQQILCNWPTLW